MLPTAMALPIVEKEQQFLNQTGVYQQILDAIADMVLVKGKDSRILWANRAFCDYYAMSNEQLRDLIDARGGLGSILILRHSMQSSASIAALN